MTTTKESLEQIKKYLCSGNPIWDVDAVRAVMDEAIEAVEKQKRSVFYGKDGKDIETRDTSVRPAKSP